MPIIIHCPGCGPENRVRIAAAGQGGRRDAEIVVPALRGLLERAPDSTIQSETGKRSGTDWRLYRCAAYELPLFRRGESFF